MGEGRADGSRTGQSRVARDVSTALSGAQLKTGDLFISLSVSGPRLTG